MKNKFFLFAFVLLSLSIQASPCDKLSGIIRSKGRGVPYATISVLGTSIGTVADYNGVWTLTHVPEGPFKMRIQSMGYVSLEQEIDCNQAATELVFELTAERIHLDEVVVTGSRYEVLRSDAPVIVNLLRRETLQGASSVVVSDGLSLIPGLRVENSCQNCGFQEVRINGLEGPYSQILIDSRPIISALSGVYGIEQIPTAMIDRVEVVRGGGSALYGSNAIAGTINIITREPTDNHAMVSSSFSAIGGKSFDKNLHLNVTLVNPEYTSGISLFSSIRGREPWDANEDGFSEIGIINARSAGLRSYVKTGSSGKLTATYHYIDEFRRGGNKFELKPHETDITEQTAHSIHGGELVFDRLQRNNKGKWSVYASSQYILRDSYYGAGQDPNAYGNTSDLTFVAGSQWFRQMENQQPIPLNLIAGAEWQHNQMHDRMPGYNRNLKQEINMAGIYGQAELKHRHASLLLGMRADKHNLISKTILSPRATLLAKFSENSRWRTSFSTGFRAPQAFDEDLHILAVNGGVMLIRLNPDLRPEYSQSWSSSFEITTTAGTTPVDAVAELFYTRLFDVFVLETIETDPSGNMIVERRNGSGAMVYGINLEQRMEVGNRVSLQAGMTLQRSKYLEPEFWSNCPEAEPLHQLPKSPDVYGYANLSTHLTKHWSAGLSTKLTGPMKVPHYAGYTDKDQIKTTQTFFEVDLKTEYTIPIANDWQLKMETGIQNVLNSFQKDFDVGPYRDAGYMYGPLKPRTFYVGIRLQSNS